MKKILISELIKRLNKVHNNKYEYDFSEYENTSSKINITCPIHGNFKQRIYDHSKGRGCPICGMEKNINSKRNNLDDLKIRSSKIHNNQYDYSLIKDYKNMHGKVDIICPKHGIFRISFHSHINKHRGCKWCAIDNMRDDKNSFILKSNKIHNNRYDYSKVNYINSKTKVIIGCPKHGDFEQAPNYHILGQGCPICKESKGEREIRNILIDKNIKFEYQKKFCDLKIKNYCLLFDFYLPEYNICIEYDGEQHFRPVKYWGGNDGFIKRKVYDEKKNSYCELKNIRLLRIYYDDTNIDKRIKKFLNLSENIIKFSNLNTIHHNNHHNNHNYHVDFFYQKHQT